MPFGYFEPRRFLPEMRSLASRLMWTDGDYMVIHRPVEIEGLPHRDLDRQCWCRPYVAPMHELRDIAGLAKRLMAEQRVN